MGNPGEPDATVCKRPWVMMRQIEFGLTEECANAEYLVWQGILVGQETVGIFPLQGTRVNRKKRAFYGGRDRE